MEEFEISISSLKKLKHTITLQPSVDKIKTTYSQTAVSRHSILFKK